QPTEAELHRLAQETADFARAATAYAEAIAGLEDEERIAELFGQKGKLEEEKLGDAALATASYKEAVLRIPADNEAVFSLIRAGHASRLFADAAWAVVEGSRASGKVVSEQLAYFA